MSCVSNISWQTPAQICASDRWMIREIYCFPLRSTWCESLVTHRLRIRPLFYSPCCSCLNRQACCFNAGSHTLQVPGIRLKKNHWKLYQRSSVKRVNKFPGKILSFCNNTYLNVPSAVKTLNWFRDICWTMLSNFVWQPQNLHFQLR